jgi:hypothetical protein
MLLWLVIELPYRMKNCPPPPEPVLPAAGGATPLPS